MQSSVVRKALPVLDEQPSSSGSFSTSHPEAYSASFAEAHFRSGFYALEADDRERFRWMGLGGRLEFPPLPASGFFELRVWSGFYDLRQQMTFEVGGLRSSVALPRGWRTLSIPLPAGCGAAQLRVDRLWPRALRPGDPRQLAVRVAAPRVHHDAERHRVVMRQFDNAVLNVREAIEGAAELRSTPTDLGIDMYGACNVKPPCVYCDWDQAKAMEQGNVDAPFNLDTLGEYGAFFDNASSLINCSIGEPFMMKDFDALLDAFGRHDKHVEITTNGQILTDRNIRRLLGRRINLYVSLDAATRETYARLRNDTFDRIIDNLRRLVAAKGGRGGDPRVHLIFMPMKVNVHELEDFVKLCADLAADLLVLRPLSDLPRGDDGLSRFRRTYWDREWEREGYRYVYSEELLDFEELVRVSGRAAALCARHGVPLADQLDFGGEMRKTYPRQFEEAFAAEERVSRSSGGRSSPQPAAPETAAGSGDVEPEPPLESPSAPSHETAEPADDTPGEGRLPACTEPWKSLYILRRGVMPCCYGHAPIAPMQDYRSAWNSPALKDIRRHLARGEFHAYCLEAAGCPIVRKAHHVLPGQDSGIAGRLRRSAWLRFRQHARGALGYALAADAALLGGRAFRFYCRLSGRVPRRHPRR